MPKLWVGFLKCVYQTQPRSFHVLLQVLHSQFYTAFCLFLLYDLKSDYMWHASASLIFQVGYVGLNCNLFGTPCSCHLNNWKVHSTDMLISEGPLLLMPTNHP